MRYKMQYGRPEQFILITQLIAPFGGSLDMNPDSFGKHESGTGTVVVEIPDANAPAFEKVVALFELTEYCTKL